MLVNDRKRENREKPSVEQLRKAAGDPQSIGNILLAMGTPQHALERAIDFQLEHPDLLLGETLVYLGLLDRSKLDIAIEKQRILRMNNEGGERTKAVLDKAQLAAHQTRQISQEIDRFSLQVALLGKTK